jgi:hypothetical protein
LFGCLLAEGFCCQLLLGFVMFVFLGGIWIASMHDVCQLALRASKQIDVVLILR